MFSFLKTDSILNDLIKQKIDENKNATDRINHCPWLPSLNEIK